MPDHVDIICEMACGAQAHLSFSAVTGLGRTDEVWLYGSQGTLKYDAASTELFLGKRGDEKLTPVSISPDKEGSWRVEEEFINAIRGVEPIRLTTFQDGVKYMEFTEAVTRSAQAGKTVSLPL